MSESMCLVMKNVSLHRHFYKQTYTETDYFALY